MMDLEKIRPVAKMAFENKLRNQLEWVTEKCYPHNLDIAIKDLNEILKAAILLGVGPNAQLQEYEIKKLVEDLAPLKVLGMKDEIREELIFILNTIGVNPNIFNG